MTGFQPGLPADGLLAFRAASLAREAVRAFFQNGPAHGGVLLQKFLQLFRTMPLTRVRILELPSLGFRLALELGLGELDGNDAGQALPAVLAGDLLVVFFKIFSFSLPQVFRALVRARLNPSSCMPPPGVWTLLAKETMISL